MFAGRFPDITAAQVVALVVALLGVATAFGADLSAAQEDSLLDLVKIVAGGLFLGDAGIRVGRNLGTRATPPVTSGVPPAVDRLP